MPNALKEIRLLHQKFDSVRESNTNGGKENCVWNDGNLKKIAVVLDSLYVTNSYEEVRKPHRQNEVEKKISDLNIRYIVESSRLSINYEKWAAHRRLSIQMIQNVSKRIQQMKAISGTGRMVFSSADVISTLSSLILQNVQSEWSSRLLNIAGALGLMSFACGMVESMKTRTIIEEVITEFRKDQVLAQNLQASFQNMNEFDECVQGLFPNGVDWRIIEFIQTPGLMEPAVKKQFEEIHKALDSPKDNLQICLAVLLSNVPKDPKLLDDETFLYTVKMFSKSPFAEKWWNRKRCSNFFANSKSPKVLFQLNRLLKVDTAPLQALPLLTTPILYTNRLPTLFSMFLNSVVVIDAFMELNENTPSKERETLTDLERILSTEYHQVTEIYDIINPHYD